MRNSTIQETVFLNDRFLPVSEAKISVSGPGFLFGWALFETMRSFKGKIVNLEAHLTRIQRSCRILNIKFPYSLEKLKRIIKETAKINCFQDSYIKLILSKADKGTDTVVTVKKYIPYSPKKYARGFSGCIAKLRQNECSPLANIKSTNYLLYRLSLKEAKDRGLDEALILNTRGYIAEGSRSNVFLVKDKEIFTPSLECGCLDGITRRVILDLAKKYNIKSHEGILTCRDLSNSSEAFLTNSLMGVMPLVSLEKHPVANGLAGRLTKFFMQKYKFLFRKGT
jgi:branched-chain amino acid aminotransferase